MAVSPRRSARRCVASGVTELAPLRRSPTVSGRKLVAQFLVLAEGDGSRGRLFLGSKSVPVGVDVQHPLSPLECRLSRRARESTRTPGNLGGPRLELHAGAGVEADGLLGEFAEDHVSRFIVS